MQCKNTLWQYFIGPIIRRKCRFVIQRISWASQVAYKVITSCIALLSKNKLTFLCFVTFSQKGYYAYLLYVKWIIYCALDLTVLWYWEVLVYFTFCSSAQSWKCVDFILLHKQLQNPLSKKSSNFLQLYLIMKYFSFVTFSYLSFLQ